MKRIEKDIVTDIWIRDAAIVCDGVEVGGYIGARYQKAVERVPDTVKGAPIKGVTGKTFHDLILFVEDESARFFIDIVSHTDEQPRTMELTVKGLDKQDKPRTISGKFRIEMMEGVNPATVDLRGKGVQIV